MLTITVLLYNFFFQFTLSRMNNNIVFCVLQIKKNSEHIYFFVDISTISLDLLLFLVIKNQFYPRNGLISVKNISLLFGTFILKNYVQYKKFPKSNSKLFLWMGRPYASHITFKWGYIFRVFSFSIIKTFYFGLKISTNFKKYCS